MGAKLEGDVPMIAFDIPDMSCGHCRSTIETAIRSVDPSAGIVIDLGARKAQIETARDAGAIAEAIRNAGYAVTPAA
jgi:copper chaperone